MERLDKRLDELTRFVDGFSIPAISRIIYFLDILDDAVTNISGGKNHTIARTRMGDCPFWGFRAKRPIGP